MIVQWKHTLVSQVGKKEKKKLDDSQFVFLMVWPAQAQPNLACIGPDWSFG